MKLTNRMALTASLLLISGATFGHFGQETFGDGVNIEYFLATGATAAVRI